ncbi:MAG: glycosyl hydrolase family 28 protein [Saprospiraceae bacterium]|nr:glycosyl hydrolase family 28 protein [Saprospiraceae bacterium]
MTVKNILPIILLFISFTIHSKDYNASFFGIESNGTKVNTTSIQKAIDYIHGQGGGRLVFHVGRYITGSIYLKSNVTIQLNEGAVLIGSLNPFDYNRHHTWMAMIFALKQNNIAITGKGTIDGRGYKLAQNIITMYHRGIYEDPYFSNDRPNSTRRPHNIYFKGCNKVTIQGVHINNPTSWNQQYDQCKNLLIENITVDSKNYWNNDGMDIVDCDNVIIRNNYIDASDDGICLKSHHPDSICKNVLIYNNTIRSSASAIKFGTVSRGGFKNINIIKNIVFDTYRSAVTFAAVDGGTIENIVVDSLKVFNTGNLLFLRIGERKIGRKGMLKNVSISNVYAEIPATKPDAGYHYEGPIEHMPRNISPASIVGMPNVAIENISLNNIEIHYPGNANPIYAKVALDELDSIPELSNKYPEFSMFKELPAWGFYIRHAKGITFNKVIMSCKKEDFRVAIVLDDVHDATFKNLKINDPGKSDSENSDLKKNIYLHNSSDIKIK